jgi:predicted MPP superfamily phosphohydrolase
MKKKYLSLTFILGLLTSCVSKTYDVMDYRLTMEFHDDFKILQLTDLHFGIESHLESQFAFVKQSINEANPDLIILTGDNFMYASQAVVKNTIYFINNCCKELSNKDNNSLTKFAFTFGNHDNQGDYYRYFINDVIIH